jgi:hypothetical protein
MTAAPKGVPDTGTQLAAMTTAVAAEAAMTTAGAGQAAPALTG